MDLLSSDSKVYKLVGPVLLNVDADEAKDNIAKRIQFIEKELERLQGLTGNLYMSSFHNYISYHV